MPIDFRRHARVGAAEDAGEGVLPQDEGRTFRGEIMARHHAFEIAAVPLDEALQRRVAGKDVLRTGRGLGVGGRRPSRKRQSHGGGAGQFQKVASGKGMIIRRSLAHRRGE